MPRLMTEPICMLLVCGFAYHFLQVYRGEKGRGRNTVVAAAYLGYLALTKVLFGYVIGAGIILLGISLIITRKRIVARNLVICCIALLICVPYLVSTYSRTGKVFYWATSGGLSLYWMSNPHEGEYGDWLAGTKPWLKKKKAANHLEFLETLRNMSAMEKDDALKKQAVRNVTNHPGKFARNWVANLGRLFSDYPYTYESPTVGTYVKMICGVVLLVLSGLSLGPAYTNRRRIPYEIGALAAFGLIYIGGSSLLSAYNRMLLPVLPLFAVWICFVIASRRSHWR
jgi:hypothetical protein